MKRTPQNYQAW